MDDQHPAGRWSGDHGIAEEASRWQTEQRRSPQRRGTRGWLGAVVLVVLAVAWLALCSVVVSESIAIATAEDGAEVLFLGPPIYVVLSAVGTGLVIEIGCRILGRGPSVGWIVGSVLAGAAVGLAVGTVAAFALAALFMALIGGDSSDPSTGSAWLWATTFLIFALPVVVGVGGVLFFVAVQRLRGRRRDDAG